MHLRTSAWIVSATLLAAAFAVRLPAQSAYRWELPPSVSPPIVPADNPMSEDKAELGRYLFYDTRLSGNGTQSCATCHEQSRAFADQRPRGVGSTGEMHTKGSMSLVNVAYAAVLTWGNPKQTQLEAQALVPMYGRHPVELGLDESDKWIGPLLGDETYQRLFARAFPGERAPITRDNAVKAIATFERSLVSMRSPYDRYHFERDETAISEAARRGEILFHSNPLSCFTCHGGVHFSNAMGARRQASEVTFHNTGLYNLAGALSYPSGSEGMFETTRDPRDVGRFKVPTLRNVAVTAPYMHDGSVPTLEAAIDHYAAGGRTISSGPHAGVGRDNPNKTDTVRGFAITPAQRADLVAFLESLTDEAMLRDPRYANPWR
ncbi:MAG: di-heme enzyme [Acidobacteria bacterium]|nr:di-heme enzyme [Acidobacteriota bacterium]